MEDQTQQFLQAEAQRAAEELGVKTDDAPQTPAPEPAPVPDATEAPAQVEGTPQTQAVAPEPQAPEGQTPVNGPTEEEDDYPEIPTFVPNMFQQPQAQPEQAPQPVQPAQPPVQPAPSQQQPPLPQLDPSQFTDQYGNVDMARFTAAMRARDENLIGQVTQNLTQQLTGNFNTLTQSVIAQARQEATNQIMAAETEKRSWERTFSKYPQVKENKELRDQIHKMRLGEMAVTGKPVAPIKMAERYFSQIRQAREDGVRQAVETTKVQATAHLETANNTASDKAVQRQESWNNIANKDRKVSTDARTALLKQMLADKLI